MLPTQRFQVLLEPEQLEALRRVETETGTPVARQIRMAVDRWLRAVGEQQARKKETSPSTGATVRAVPGTAATVPGGQTALITVK
jgi:hypothetical protein